MRQFWLCIFFVTCVSVFAADYSSGNRKTDAVTSATEYTGTPKNFKNGKNVDEQAAQIPAEEKSEEEPKIVLPERADDESLKTESAMHFLPETFEEDKPTIILSDENGETEDSG
ncbi:MAG: hypothetical protein J1G30_06460, partial [Spirochaetales bacterium]|nr:hypothetical protein [Spirochaetales bacterium]